jgi:hypothetical protein
MDYVRLADEAAARYRAEVAYREVCRRIFGLIAAGCAASLAECDAALADEVLLAAILGPTRAQELRHQEARTWYTTTGACPWCGAPEAYHDPGRAGASA